MNTILGKKVGMTQVFVNDLRIPVTKVVAGPCVVTQIRNEEKDGYWAIQLGFDSKRAKLISKPLQGHLKSTKKEKIFPRYIKEIRLEKEPEFKVGDEILASQIFKKGDVVTVIGTSKGKGFAGGVKRWGFAGGPKTHGQSDRTRAPGSIGAGTTPGRVYRGKHMAGRMGTDRVSLINLHIIDISPEENELLISGPIPGRIGSLVTVVKTAEGSLKDLEKEVATQVVEGEPEPEEAKEGQVPETKDSNEAAEPKKEGEQANEA